MRVSDFKRRAIKRNKTSKYIYNIDTEDFKDKYDGREYVIRAGELGEYLIPIANHIANHLADHMINKDGTKGKASEAVKQELLNQINVKL